MPWGTHSPLSGSGREDRLSQWSQPGSHIDKAECIGPSDLWWQWASQAALSRRVRPAAGRQAAISLSFALFSLSSLFPSFNPSCHLSLQILLFEHCHAHSFLCIYDYIHIKKQT